MGQQRLIVLVLVALLVPLEPGPAAVRAVRVEIRHLVVRSLLSRLLMVVVLAVEAAMQPLLAAVGELDWPGLGAMPLEPRPGLVGRTEVLTVAALVAIQEKILVRVGLAV